MTFCVHNVGVRLPCSLMYSLYVCMKHHLNYCTTVERPSSSQRVCYRRLECGRFTKYYLTHALRVFINDGITTALIPGSL